MNIEAEEGTDAKSKFEEVNADVPLGLSILPVGLDEHDSETFIVLPDDSDTVQKLLEQAGVEVSELDVEDDSSILVLRSEELILPTLYVAYIFTRDNWDQIKYVFEKLSEYYSQRYNQEVKMSVEQETADGETTRLTYQGPPERLEELSEKLANIVGVEIEFEDEREG